MQEIAAGLALKNRAIRKYATLQINSGYRELFSKCRCILSLEVFNSRVMADVESSQHNVHRKKKPRKHEKRGFLFGFPFLTPLRNDLTNSVACVENGPGDKWEVEEAVRIWLHAAKGSRGEGHRRNSPWSFNGKTSRPKEVGSSWKDGEWEGRREGGWGDKRKSHYWTWANTLFTLRTPLTCLFKCTTQAGQETECRCGEMD